MCFQKLSTILSTAGIILVAALLVGISFYTFCVYVALPSCLSTTIASLGHRGEALLGSATASIAKPGRSGDDFSGYGEQAAGISGSELATMNRGAGVEQHRSRLAT